MKQTLPRFFNKRERLETKQLLPRHNIVLLPGITLLILTGRSESIVATESAMLTEDKQLIIATMRPDVYDWRN